MGRSPPPRPAAPRPPQADRTLRIWAGEEANEAEAAQAFSHRVRCNGEARYGRYTEELERALAA